MCWEYEKGGPLTHYRQRCRSETKTFTVFQRIILVQYCQNFENITPSKNLNFNNFGIFQSLKLRDVAEKKILPISLKLNFTPYTLGCYGLSKSSKYFRNIFSAFFFLQVYSCCAPMFFAESMPKARD